jgi:flagellar basal-body rod protein FlgB
MEPSKLHLLRRAMGAYVQRRRAVASNLSNLDTPEYDRLSVAFEEELRSARDASVDLRSPDEVEPRLEVGDEAPILENELMEMADTQMRTQFATRALRDHFALMRTGITGRSA